VEQKKGWLSWERGMETTGFCGSRIHVWVYSVVVEGACVRDCRGLQLCAVGTVS
jgi:hypothetical protein